MIKLPTVKVNGQTAFVINRHQVEDDVAVAEAICRDAARWRKLIELWNGGEIPVDELDAVLLTRYVDERK